MHDFSGSSNIEIPPWATKPPVSQQDAPMTTQNKQILLAIVVLGVMFLVLCCM